MEKWIMDHIARLAFRTIGPVVKYGETLTLIEESNRELAEAGCEPMSREMESHLLGNGKHTVSLRG